MECYVAFPRFCCGLERVLGRQSNGRTYCHRRVWGEPEQEDLRPVRTMVGELRRELGDDSE